MKVKVRTPGQTTPWQEFDGVGTIFPQRHGVCWIGDSKAESNTLIVTLDEEDAGAYQDREGDLHIQKRTLKPLLHVFPRFRLIEEREF